MSSPIFESTSPLIAQFGPFTMTAGEDLVAGVLVEITAAWTVKKPTAINSLKVLGLTMTNALNGQKVTVLGKGILSRAKAYGAISAGDQLTSAQAGGTGNPGCVQTDNSSKNTSILGLAVEGIASGGTGVIFLW